MWPVILSFMRAYAPVITLPFAAVVGVIGYNVEKLFDRSTPAPLQGIKETREERRLDDGGEEAARSLKEHAFVPKSVFEKNMSPTLKPVS